MTSATQSVYDAATRCVDDEAADLNELSQSIWSKPELNFEEKHAHEVLCNFLEKRGFDVERSYTGIETAFKASWDNFKDTDQNRPHVVVICEYDALPEIGHACGHNLIAETGVAAGLGVKAALETCGDLRGKITVLGTPAEEGGAGKSKLIDNGAFEDVDVAMMVHPTSMDATTPTCLAVISYTVTYRGHAVHASAAPWEGVNALDAAVMAYNGISSLRQQMKPDNRMHAIISKGGTKPNIIPDHTEMEIFFRAITKHDLDVLVDKAMRCFNGAAITTGCQVEITPSMTPYDNLVSNIPLVELYEKHMATLAPEIGLVRDHPFRGSTDMGNVSHEVPAIHPFYRIGEAINHTKDFTVVSGAPEAQGPTLRQGKVLALVALDVMSNSELRENIKAEFHRGKNNF